MGGRGMLLAPATMKRWTMVVVGVLFVALIGGLVWKSGSGGAKPAGLGSDAGAASGNRADGSMGQDASSFADPFLTQWLEPDGGLRGTEPTDEHERGVGLPSGSPKTVRFGVILVQYRGAELAPPVARSKDEARSLARSLAEAAKTDFKAQVQRGDPGSMDDAGRIPRGVLEPPVEFALFTLTRGDVSEPIDTPRGFWIVRRIE